MVSRKSFPQAGGQLRFGTHVGKTLEWVAFNDPGYLNYMISNNILPKTMPGRFFNLVSRAMCLRVPARCTQCGKPATRMSLHWMKVPFYKEGKKKIGAVDWWCHEHEPFNAGWEMHRMSLFVYETTTHYDKCGHKILLDSIRYHYGLKTTKMTQEAIEAFFANDDNFWIKRAGEMEQMLRDKYAEQTATA